MIQAKPKNGQAEPKSPALRSVQDNASSSSYYMKYS